LSLRYISGNGRASSSRGWRRVQEITDEVLHQLPGVEAAFVSDKVITDAGERNDVNPGSVVASLLEGGRDEGGRDVLEGVESRVVTAV
jgi:hypothetical protein